MPGRHNALNATAAIAVAHELGAPIDVDPQGDRRVWRRQAALHPHGRMEWRRHLRRLRPPSGRNRRGAESRAGLDRGQGDRGRAAASLSRGCASLFDAFATCFNDADTVIVADVYPAGETPIEGVDKAALVDRDRRPRPSPRADAAVARETGRAWCTRWRKPGDYVICLGAGSITQWAYALPGELRGREGRRAMSFPDIASPERASCRSCADVSSPTRRSRPDTWFRAGGPGAGPVLSGRRSRPRLFSEACRREFR